MNYMEQQNNTGLYILITFIFILVVGIAFYLFNRTPKIPYTDTQTPDIQINNSPHEDVQSKPIETPIYNDKI